MDRDIKRAKGADEQPIATKRDSILEHSRIEQLEEELRTRDALIETLTREVRFSFPFTLIYPILHSFKGPRSTLCNSSALFQNCRFSQYLRFLHYFYPLS